MTLKDAKKTDIRVRIQFVDSLLTPDIGACSIHPLNFIPVSDMSSLSSWCTDTSLLALLGLFELLSRNGM